MYNYVLTWNKNLSPSKQRQISNCGTWHNLLQICSGIIVESKAHQVILRILRFYKYTNTKHFRVTGGVFWGELSQVFGIKLWWSEVPFLSEFSQFSFCVKFFMILKFPTLLHLFNTAGSVIRLSPTIKTWLHILRSACGCSCTLYLFVFFVFRWLSRNCAYVQPSLRLDCIFCIQQRIQDMINLQGAILRWPPRTCGHPWRHKIQNNW